MKEQKSRNVIPLGIFLFVFFILILLSAAVSLGYFYFEAKTRISEIEKYTRDYSIPLAEAFANVAELSYKTKNLKKLKTLFREKIQANIIDEAFFVLSDGTIIVHSNKVIEKELKGNIATDEFAYNIDLIMLPVWTKTSHAQMMDYHIYNDTRKLPFNKELIKLLKKYIYPKIDISGWLVTRAVYYKNKSIGCVSFIISRDRIKIFLLDHFNNTVRLSVILGAISFIISFLLFIILFVRYRSINKIKYGKRVAGVSGYFDDNIDRPAELDVKNLKEAIKIKSPGSMKEIVTAGKKVIKDAMLVKDK